MSNKKISVVNVIMLVMCMNIFVKIFSFTRDFLLGKIVGVGFEMDAYLTSLSITTRFFLAFGAAIVTTMVPIIVKEKDELKRKEKLTDINTFVFFLGLLITIIYLVFTPQIISGYVSGFSEEKLLLTTTLTRILIPSIFFILYTNFFVGIMQCNQRYLIATSISIPYNILIILYISLAKDFNIYFLTFVTLLGWFGQMCVVMPSVIKMKSFKIKLNSFYNENFKVFLKSFTLVFIVVATIQLLNITNNKFLSYFDDGIVSTYFYGNMIYNTIVSLIVYAITVVMFPKFNESFLKDKGKFFFFVERVLSIVIILLIPICGGMFLVGDQMMMILFLGESYPMESVLITAKFMIIFSVASVGFGFNEVLNKAYYSADDKFTPIKTTLIIIATNFILNYFFIRILELNHYYVVVATVMSYYLGIAFSLYVFPFEEKKQFAKGLLTTFVKSMVSVIIMYIVVYGLQVLLFPNPFDLSMTNRVVYIFMSVIIGVPIYFLICFILKEKIVYDTIKLIRNRKGEK
ncbi:MAG: murein biosynthesis integral membrane protein MurJ [Lachnospirales bacterium]